MPVRSKKRRPVSAPASHPLGAGAKVPVFIIADDGQPIFEGWVSIVSACISYPNWYRVRLRDEQVTRIRFINPDWQKNPERSFALLREFLHTGALSPFDEFFPPDL